MDLQRAYTMVQATRQTMPHADCVLCALSDTERGERVLVGFGADAALLASYGAVPLQRVAIGAEVVTIARVVLLESEELLHSIVRDNRVVAIAEDYDGPAENWPDEIEVKI